MRLLVSVRSPDEVAASLEGGADIIDAKEPALGAMGPVAPDVLEAIDERVPPGVPFSVALGEAASAASVAAAIRALPLRRRARLYVKAAFPLEGGEPDLAARMQAAAGAAARHSAGPRLIAVAYADTVADSSALHALRRMARQAGAAGVLLDTVRKDGRTLLDCWPVEWLRGWADALRGDGLEVALAGSLGSPELQRIAGLGPAIVGVRGAACTGGREGSVDAGRVRALRATIPAGWGIGADEGSRPSPGGNGSFSSSTCA